MVADNQSHLNFGTILELLQLNESFPDEQLMPLKVLLWYADIINYLVIGQLLELWTWWDWGQNCHMHMWWGICRSYSSSRRICLKSSSKEIQRST